MSYIIETVQASEHEKAGSVHPVRIPPSSDSGCEFLNYPIKIFIALHYTMHNFNYIVLTFLYFSPIYSKWGKINWRDVQELRNLALKKKKKQIHINICVSRTHRMEQTNDSELGYNDNEQMKNCHYPAAGL